MFFQLCQTTATSCSLPSKVLNPIVGPIGRRGTLPINFQSRQAPQRSQPLFNTLTGAGPDVALFGVFRT